MPVFGKTSIGGTEFTTLNNEYDSTKHTLNQDAYVVAMWAYCRNADTNALGIKLAIYTDNAGVPQTFKGATDELTIAASAPAAWRRFVVSTPFLLTAGTYHLGHMGYTGTVSAGVKILADTPGGNVGAFDTQAGYPNFDATTSGASTDTVAYSIYAEIAYVAPSVTVDFKRNAFPFMNVSQSGRQVGGAAVSDPRHDSSGPVPYGGFERILFPRIHQVAAATGTTIDLTGGALDHGRTLGSPTVNPGLAPSGLVHTRAQGAPQVNPQLLPAGLTRARAQGSLLVTTGTTLSPAGLVHTRAQGSLTVNPNLAPASLTRTRAQGAVTINVKILMAGLAHTRAQGAPVVATATVLQPSGLAHTRAQGTVVVNDKLITAGLSRIRAQGALKVSPQIVMTGLVHTRVQGIPLTSTPGGGGPGTRVDEWAIHASVRS